MKHPLLDNKSKHYDMQEKPTIYNIEKYITVNGMIAVCNFNIMKYANREKGQNVSDTRKIRYYRNYLSFLTDIINEYPNIGNDTVRSVIDEFYKDIEY